MDPWMDATVGCRRDSSWASLSGAMGAIRRAGARSGMEGMRCAV